MKASEMTVLHAESGPDRFEINEVISQLRSGCQFLTEVGDKFVREHARLELHIAELNKEGTPIRNPEILFKRLEMRREQIGQGTDIELKSNTGVLCNGYVAETQIYLRIDQSQTDALAVNEVVQLLRKCGATSVEIIDKSSD